ncbi:hypothetical protein C4H12_04060 [Capnocytophaga sp. oral taxon 878]|nr:hypothetical protein C4H12_04060 [Capnocytophaga sp. oral taxon 878]
MVINTRNITKEFKYNIMNQIYFMVPNTKAKRTPIYLDGILHTRFIPREDYKRSSLPPVLDDDE